MDQARESVARRYCPHRLTLGVNSRLDLVHNSAPIGADVTLNYMRYGGEVHITPGRLEDFYLVQVPVAGNARLRIGARELHCDRQTGSVTSPTEPIDMIWSNGCEKLVIYIRRGALEAAADTGGAPVIFDARLDLTAPATQAWTRLVHFAVDSLSSPATGLFDSPLVTTNFEQTLISGLLSIQANDAHTEMPTRTPVSRAVRAAIALIEDRPEHPWRVTDLASEVGVSTRSLQDLFARELNTTPLHRLRSTRLERARQQLVESSPADTSVTDVAARWGFFHAGRFADAYRATFSELPSETLAR
ncbi:AraC family transcriptional regulator [Gordonia sp. NPDC003504]